MPSECEGEAVEIENGAIHMGTLNRERKYEGFGIR